MNNKKTKSCTRIFKNNNSVAEEIESIRIELCNRFLYTNISDLTQRLYKLSHKKSISDKLDNIIAE